LSNTRPLSASHSLLLSESQMLHRSPSGAQKKIRQRQEKRFDLTNQSSASALPASSASPPTAAVTSNSVDHRSMASSVSTANTSSVDCEYRSVIDSGAYHSILPDEPPFIVTQSKSSKPQPPQPPPRPSPPKVSVSTPPWSIPSPMSSPNSSLNSTTSGGYASSIPANSLLNSAFIVDSGGKPMVEVHPMPSQQFTEPASLSASSSLKDFPSSCENQNQKPKEKPRVPKKPMNLVLNSSSKLNSPSLNALSLSSTSLNMLPFTPLTPSQSSTSVSRLFTTPSLICLHTALMKTDLNEEEIAKVESKRQKVCAVCFYSAVGGINFSILLDERWSLLQLIESLSKKITVLDEEHQSLQTEIESNELLRGKLIEELTLKGSSDVSERMRLNLDHNTKLIRLQTKLRMQLERLESMLNNNMEGIDREAISARIERVKSQINDQSSLREVFERRDSLLSVIIESRLDDESVPQWRLYKETWKKLTEEQQEIEERLQIARDQLSALQNVQAATTPTA
uniref:ASD2 domain-containing protein n=1 Tax=Anisakis simplex TaxID=6269 RepID=A0A0M3K6Z9_ANISI